MKPSIRPLCRPQYRGDSLASILFRLAMLSILVLSLGQVSDQSPQDLAAQLRSDNPTAVAAAVAQIHVRITEEPIPSAALIRTLWLKPLIEKKRFAEALDLALAAICAAPQDLSAVEFLQRQRIELLHQLGQNEEVLAQSKALFNFCPMPATEQTLLLLAESLDRARGNDSPLIDQFITEQRDGDIPSDKAVPCIVLQAIHIDATPYEPTIRALHLPSGDLPVAAPQLLALGNLCLLADRPADALAAFQKFRAAANPGQLRLAHESIARALRAQDGTIGRANEYIQSLTH